MPKRSSKPKKNGDVNEIAASIVDAVDSLGTPGPGKETKEKNPAAVALGRLGGLKGGKARAENLTPEERQEIARKAARARWANKGRK